MFHGVQRTNTGNDGSNRCSHSFSYPSRVYHAMEVSASATRRIGITSSTRHIVPVLEPPRTHPLPGSRLGEIGTSSVLARRVSPFW